MAATGERCQATCWKGAPEHPMAAKAKCKQVVGHGDWHKDANGNVFDDDGTIVAIGIRRAS